MGRGCSCGVQRVGVDTIDFFFSPICSIPAETAVPGVLERDMLENEHSGNIYGVFGIHRKMEV